MNTTVRNGPLGEIVEATAHDENPTDGASEASATAEGKTNRLRSSINRLTDRLAGAGQHVADTATEVKGEETDGLQALRVYAFHMGNRATKRGLAYARKPVSFMKDHAFDISFFAVYVGGLTLMFGFGAWIYTLSAPIGAVIIFLLALNTLVSIGSGFVAEQYHKGKNLKMHQTVVQNYDDIIGRVANV